MPHGRAGPTRQVGGCGAPSADIGPWRTATIDTSFRSACAPLSGTSRCSARQGFPAGLPVGPGAAPTGRKNREKIPRRSLKWTYWHTQGTSRSLQERLARYPNNCYICELQDEFHFVKVQDDSTYESTCLRQRPRARGSRRMQPAGQSYPGRGGEGVRPPQRSRSRRPRRPTGSTGRSTRTASSSPSCGTIPPHSRPPS